VIQFKWDAPLIEMILGIKRDIRRNISTFASLCVRDAAASKVEIKTKLKTVDSSAIWQQ
jgi:hypothetical protein